MLAVAVPMAATAYGFHTTMRSAAHSGFDDRASRRADRYYGPPPTAVQGNALRTWSERWPSQAPNQLVLGTDGRPLDADVELWQGPGNTPRRMRVYSEDGYLRPFRSTEPPRGQPNTMAVRNAGPLEFPMYAQVGGGDPRGLIPPPADYYAPRSSAFAPAIGGKTVQGGAVESFPIDPSVDSVQIFLQTEGRNLEAKVEVLQGPNNVRQEIEINEDYGYDRPFSCVLDTPGYGSVVRITNTAPMTFPFKASVIPHSISPPGYHDGYYQGDPYSAQMGGGTRPAINGGGYSADYRDRGSYGRGGWGGQTSLGGGGGYDYRPGGGRYGYGSGDGGRYPDVQAGVPHGMQYGRSVY